MSHGHDDHGRVPHAPHGLGILDTIPDDPVELPPEPAVRSITPAREEYERPYPGPGIAWPIVWLLVAVGFWWSTRVWHGDVEAPHAEHGAHAAE